MPAFHGRRLQQALSHEEALVCQLVNAQRRGTVAAGLPDGTHEKFHWTLHPRIACLFRREIIRQEQRPQDGANFVAGVEVRLHHGLDHLLTVAVHLIGGEELEQPGANETSRCLLTGDNANDVLTVEIARLTQERLLAIVVVPVAELEVPGDTAVGPDRILAGAHRHVLGIPQRPAGEGAGALLDVVFRVVADAHGEQFEQFAPVVLVDGAIVVIGVVQPQQHRRVLGQLHQQVVETPQAVVAEHVDLIEQGSRLIQLAVAGGKQPVPEQGDLFFQRALGGDHAVQPIGPRAVQLPQFGLIHVVTPDDVVRHHLRVAGIEQFVYRCRVALRGVSLKLVPRGSKAGAAHQVGQKRKILITHLPVSFLVQRRIGRLGGRRYAAAGLRKSNCSK